jgi:hypothetical protein
MEATRSSETSVYTKLTRLHIPEDCITHSHRSGNLKSYTAHSIHNALLRNHSALLCRYSLSVLTREALERSLTLRTGMGINEWESDLRRESSNRACALTIELSRKWIRSCIKPFLIAGWRLDSCLERCTASRTACYKQYGDLHSCHSLINGAEIYSKLWALLNN